MNAPTKQSPYACNTPPFVGSFVWITKPQKNDADEDVYGLSCLFGAGDDLKWAKEKVRLLMTDKFGPDMSKWPVGFHVPWRDQRDKAGKYDGFVPGNMYFNCSTKKKPQVVDHNVQDILDPNQIYSGAKYIANINFYWFEFRNKQGALMKQGVGVGLNVLQKIGDGTPLGGTFVDAAAVFSPVNVDPALGAAAVFTPAPAAVPFDPLA